MFIVPGDSIKQYQQDFQLVQKLCLNMVRSGNDSLDELDEFESQGLKQEQRMMFAEPTEVLTTKTARSAAPVDDTSDLCRNTLKT